ncbi:MAG: hypothetical protein MN733_07600, partial [Nitrososphaera sp.]|nr:hypothetical protein [Nitrososphaera sp.]
SEQTALLEILRLYKLGAIQLVTSVVVKEEIDKTPAEYRAQHEVIYNLLADIPISNTAWTDSGLMLMGVGGGTRIDPLYSELTGLLPDETDAQHVFQAIKSATQYFVTTDGRTILRYRDVLQHKYRLDALTPSGLLKVFTKK